MNYYNLCSTNATNTVGVAISFEILSWALAIEKEYQSLTSNQINTNRYRHCVQKVVGKVCGKNTYKKLKYLETIR